MLKNGHGTTDNGIIYVSPDWQITSKTYYRENIWLPARKLNDDIGSGAKWRTALYMVDEYLDRLKYPDGSAYMYPDIYDELFPDVTNKWMRNFLRCDGTGENPKSYSSHYERLRVVELYCRLRTDIVH
ncbi:hypothetical protein [Actibacterium ureilyticum]|uniref:hypothetical protein n=1 Tax=Actibacterium ureilyticum TaxID=1590614 RepID=UPI000BAACEC6|nr:hypothetical protein [Actibacterium ureilyticum]